jgi:hypothetical protein
MFAPPVLKPKPTRPWQLRELPKLRLGSDPWENEADRIADRVMHLPGPSAEAASSKRESGQSGGGSGQPLDPALRAFFEPRFGFDFGRVRIHADGDAAATAAAIRARAFTAGADIAFARGAFAPGTEEGRKLLAHELAHVAQQGAAHKNREAGCASLAGEIGALPTIHMPLQTKDDPNQVPQTVDPTGKLSSGKTESSKGPGVWRIPIHDLRGDKTAWAVALLPNVHLPADENAAVDVLLHFHGFGAGYRMLKPDESDFAGVLKPGQLRDVDLYEMEQQLLSLAQKAKYILAVLPQGSDRSNFGDLSKQSSAYLKEVFQRLVADGHLPKGASPGNVTVSGHSGGGVAATTAASERVASGGRQDLLLFDAINFACVEKEQQEIKGVKQVNKDGTPKMTCKRCGSNEYTTVKNWVIDRIRSDAKTLISQKNLKASGTHFRGFTHAAVDPKANSCSYGHWYGLLKDDIDKAIADLKADADVTAQLHENFQVKSVPGGHEDVLAHDSLKAALAS